MRELKFRQAIFIDGEFHSWHYWGWIDGVFVGPLTSISKGEIKPSQQFTGLPDNLSVGIYEGDILDGFSNFGDRKPMVVVWGEAGWLVKSGEQQSTYLNIVHQKEVIGHIYNNKDLLNAS